MSIAAQLKLFKAQAEEGHKEVAEFCKESPFQRTKREVQLQLAASEKYRASILKNVVTFAGLSAEAIVTAAQSMEEVYYKKGDVIIEQDDIGEAFFVLEDGLVSVTRKANIRDYNEPAKELAQLGRNSHFGEISLLTAETRSASVTVLSETAKCLIMTKSKFDELLATTNKILAENRRIIGKDVLDTVPLFKTLTAVNKKKLLDAMNPMTYQPQSYICRQGTTGHTFFILTEGTCKVTINNENRTETEVAKLRPGDFFGEVALIESSNRRTANVISLDTVSCLTLSRNDFNRLLKALKVKIQEHQVMRHNNAQLAGGHADDGVKHLSGLAKKRRISGYNTHGQRDDTRISSILRRFAKFTTESLWNSMYSRMYREMLLDSTKATEYGKLATIIMRSNDTRTTAVTSIGTQATRILEMDCPRRSVADNNFVIGLLRQRNALKDKLCRSWPAHQFAVLCKRIKLVRVKAFRKIIEADSRGTTAFLILRGAVRVFSKISSATSATAKLYFEEDLFPGEMFGEAALSGMHTRLMTVQAITNVDLAVIDDSDFVLAQDRDSMHMGTEDRVKFLSNIPMFKHWDAYKLLRLAVALVQEEVNKGVVLVTKGVPCKDMYFLVNGRVDVLDHLEKRNIVTSLLKHDYLGESGMVNKFVKASSSKVVEEHYAVAVTRVDVLILHESNYFIFDMGNIEMLRNTFAAKTLWRKDRLLKMKHERAKVRKYQHGMTMALDHLPQLDGAKEYNYTMTVQPSSDNGDADDSHQYRSRNHSFEHHESGDSYLPHFNQVVDSHHNLITMLPHHNSTTPQGLVIPVGRGQRSRSPSPTQTDRQARHSFTNADGNNTALNHSLSQQQRPATAHSPTKEKPKHKSKDPSTHSSTTNSSLSRTNSRNILRQQAKGPAPLFPEEKEKLSDIEDIPEIFTSGFDPFMVTTSIKNLKYLEKVQEAMVLGRRPKSARLLIANAFNQKEAGYREVVVKTNLSRPVSALVPAALQESGGLAFNPSNTLSNTLQNSLSADDSNANPQARQFVDRTSSLDSALTITMPKVTRSNTADSSIYCAAQQPTTPHSKAGDNLAANSSNRPKTASGFSCVNNVKDTRPNSSALPSLSGIKIVDQWSAFGAGGAGADPKLGTADNSRQHQIDFDEGLGEDDYIYNDDTDLHNNINSSNQPVNESSAAGQQKKTKNQQLELSKQPSYPPLQNSLSQSASTFTLGKLSRAGSALPPNPFQKTPSKRFPAGTSLDTAVPESMRLRGSYRIPSPKSYYETIQMFKTKGGAVNGVRREKD